MNKDTDIRINQIKIKVQWIDRYSRLGSLKIRQYQSSKTVLSLLIILFVVISAQTFGNSKVKEPKHSLTPLQRANALLEKMTLQEKISQLVLLSRKNDANGELTWDYAIQQIRDGRCGNILNAKSNEKVRLLQEHAVGQTRLGIPLLFGYDIVHGFKTIFPIPLGAAASWDLNAIEKSSRIAAVEGSSSGVCWTFAPMVDISRDPRWGRIAESPGEDTYLAMEFAKAAVRGFQGNDLADKTTILACPKHFVAYGVAQAGRDYHTVDISERTLRDTYMPPFKAAIDAGALSIMTSFNEWNGIPATGNSFLFRKVLRDEWGFSGLVVTDFTAINEMIKHGTAADEYEACVQAMQAGVDMDMYGEIYAKRLEKLVADGKVPVEQVNDAARNILRIKFMLGLFDDPFRYCDEKREKEVTYAKEHLDAAYDLSCKSLVLLKNEKQTLPLKAGLDIAVIGPLAEATTDLLGCWRGQGEPNATDTILEHITRVNGKGRVRFEQGCDVDSTDRSGFDKAIALVKTSDLAIMILGESQDMSGEAASRTNISLPGVQTELLEQVKATGKPIVLILLNGRPLILEKESRLADAVLEAWHPGTMGGKAIADTLFGWSNPSGKLTVTFPRTLGQVPIFYNMKNTGRPIKPEDPNYKFTSRYIDCPNDPLYPFGFGLSYTTYSYSKPKLDRPSLKPGGKITVSTVVSNTGSFDGAEIVQLYIRDRVGSVTRPVKELKGFQRIHLKKGRSQKVEFTMTEKDLAFLRRDMTWGTEPGSFEVFVGPDSRDAKSVEFTLLD